MAIQTTISIINTFVMRLALLFFVWVALLDYQRSNAYSPHQTNIIRRGGRTLSAWGSKRIRPRFPSEISATTLPRVSIPTQEEGDDTSRAPAVPSLATETDSEQSSTATENHVAIVLNTNARSVNREDFVPIAEELFGKDSVYVTTSEGEARECAHNLMLRHNVSLVIPVGGDGTVSSMMNYLCEASMIKLQMQQQNDNNTAALSMDDAMKNLPLVGYIPMGTGNGLGSVVGFPVKFTLRKRNKLKQVKAALQAYKRVAQNLQSGKNIEAVSDGDDDQMVDIVDLPMIHVAYESHKYQQPPQHQDELCFFAGIGFDSIMLQDFETVKSWSKRTGFLKTALSSVAGYTVALLTRTLPKCVSLGIHNVKLEIRTSDTDETVWVDHRRGDVVRKAVDEGDSSRSDNGSDKGEALLFKGTAGIVAASTTPFYGGGLRLFPFARMTNDKMHLRIGRIHPLRGFFNIPRIFAGSYRDKRDATFGCLDFIGRDFRVKVIDPDHEDGYPLQHSGESVGFVQQLRLRVLQNPVRFVTFMSKRRVEYD